MGAREVKSVEYTQKGIWESNNREGATTYRRENQRRTRRLQKGEGMCGSDLFLQDGSTVEKVLAKGKNYMLPSWI